MTPVATPDSLNTSPEVVLPIAIVAGLIVFVLFLLRRFGVAVLDELAELLRTYGPLAAKSALDRRPNLPATPWFCATCSSRNGLAARVCYRCGGERATSELAPPDAEAPAGPSAGLSRRARRDG